MKRKTLLLVAVLGTVLIAAASVPRSVSDPVTAADLRWFATYYRGLQHTFAPFDPSAGFYFQGRADAYAEIAARLEAQEP
jgi:hypothetical protein